MVFEIVMGNGSVLRLDHPIFESSQARVIDGIR